MAYVPQPIPDSEDPRILREYFERELANIAAQFELVEQGRALPMQSVAPPKPRQGTIALTDAVNWNPGLGKGCYIWLPDADGEQWLHLLLNGGRGGFGWDDEVGELTTSNPTNDPKSLVFIGDIRALAYENHPTANGEDALGQVIHIRHSYAEGTKIYPHIHWSANVTGTVRWGLEYTVAKGHQQQTFHAPITVFIEQTISTPGMHMIAEVPELDAIAADRLEPDTLILMRWFRNSSHVNDTLNGDAFAFKADIHFQRGGQVGTKNRAPNFYLG